MTRQQYQQHRREWMRETLHTLGFFAFAPAVVSAQHDHFASAQSPQSADSKPAVFTPAEDSTLAAIADTIIPGASAAGCSRAIDLLLSVDAERARNTVRQAIQAFDKESNTQFQKSFSQLSPDQRVGLLRLASNDGSRLARPFKTLKQWTSDVYWTSQPGMRELGFKGRVAWSTFPGCAHT